MSIAVVVFRRCLLNTMRALPLWLACLAGAALGDAAVAAVSTHVACFCLAAVACASALQGWPPFLRNRGETLARLHTGPLGGCGTATLAALGALTLALAALGAAFGAVSATAPVPRDHVPARTNDPPVLLLPGQSATFVWDRPQACSELLLRPLAILPADASPQPAGIAVHVPGGVPVATEVAGTNELVRIPVHGAVVDEVRIEHRAGNLPLVFPAGAMVAVSAATRSRPANTALAAVAMVPAAAVALGAAMALGAMLAAPTGLALTLALLLVLTLGDLTPAGNAVVAVQRGRWLPAEDLWSGLWQALLVAALLAVPAAAVRRRRAR